MAAKAYYIVNPHGVIHSVPSESFGMQLIQKNARYRWATANEVKAYKRKRSPVLRVDIAGGAPADVDEDVIDGGLAVTDESESGE